MLCTHTGLYVKCLHCVKQVCVGLCQVSALYCVMYLELSSRIAVKGIGFFPMVKQCGAFQVPPLFFFFPLRVCECLCVQKLGSIIPNLGDTGNRQQIQLPDCPVFPFTIPFSPSSSLVLRYTAVPKHLIHHSDDRHS